jgi:ribosomal protein L18E
MSKEEMAQLIRTVWSDSMSDNGAIWAKSSAQLQQARIDYPEIYVEALEWLYSEERA